MTLLTHNKMFKDSGLMTNGMLQMFCVSFLSALTLIITGSDYAWILAFFGLIGSLSVVLLGNASYETHPKYKGDYFAVLTLYNKLALFSTLSSYVAFYVHFVPLSNISRLYGMLFTNVVVLHYVFKGI